MRPPNAADLGQARVVAHVTAARSRLLTRLAALPLALWPTLVGAQDSTRFAWGVPVEGSGPSLLSLEPCALPCVVVVRFDNTLVTSGQAPYTAAPPVVSATLATPEVAIAVTVQNGLGMKADLMQVRLPAGYVAEPREVLVDDNASGHVRVVLVPTS